MPIKSTYTVPLLAFENYLSASHSPQVLFGSHQKYSTFFLPQIKILRLGFFFSLVILEMLGFYIT
jgi:hypothetical protein